MAYEICIKSAYTNADHEDGARVLVDRLWPQGMRREDLMLNDWYRDAAPSTELRRNWHNRAIDDETFLQKYRCELARKPDCLIPLMKLTRQGRLTLLTASRDLEASHALTLKKLIAESLANEDRQDQQNEPSSPTCYAQSDDFI